jgi:hypothetical protein
MTEDAIADFKFEMAQRAALWNVLSHHAFYASYMLQGVAMNPSAQYRLSAADCRSQHLTDPALKATMRLMAQSWSALADHTEQSSDLDHNDAPPPRG